MTNLTPAQTLTLDLTRIAERGVLAWRSDVEILRAMGERLDNGVGSEGLREGFKMRVAIRILNLERKYQAL